MSDYKRLKEKLETILTLPELPFEEDLTAVDCKQMYDILCKIEQGPLIELPCKVGDTVYVIIKAENGFALLKDICNGFLIKDGEVFIGLQTYNIAANKYYFTREEAEKRLKELQE